jgi:hypothetical protein
MKKIIDACTKEIDISWKHNTLDGIIEYLVDLRESVPGSARLNVYVGGYDGDEYSLYFTFKREETDEEYQARLKKEYWEKKRIEEDEKETYRQLKAKFEGDNK